MTSALASDQVAMWWVSLGLGLVVVIVVIVLLSLLTSLVRDIDRNVAQVWQRATGVARNTTTTWMIGSTVALSGQLREETAEHVSLLEHARRSR